MGGRQGACFLSPNSPQMLWVRVSFMTEEQKNKVEMALFHILL